jgi:DNA-binding ferritin-like protein
VARSRPDQGKQAHWNVEGPAFKPVHEFLDEMVIDHRTWYDDVAERLTAIGVSPDGRIATVSDSTPLPKLASGPISDRDALTAMDERVSLVARISVSELTSWGTISRARTC